CVFFIPTSPSELYTLSLHDALPIFHVEPKRHMVIYGVSILALGLVWIPISMHPQANQGWLQVVTGIPVLLVLFAAHQYYKKKGRSEERRVGKECRSRWERSEEVGKG